MPGEPSAYWWPVAVIAVGIVCVGAVWFTRFVVDRLDKDRSKLHEHAGKLQMHEFKIAEHDEDLKALQRERKHE